METNKAPKRLLQFFGVTLFMQAVTSLVGGSIFMGPFESNEITDATMRSIANSTSTAYTSILLQIITAVVIIMLGVAMYQVAGHKNKTMAITALSLYIFEAILLAVGQVFIFGLVEASKLYTISSDANLLVIGKLVLSCREFSGKMAMIPFGVGAILFYYLLLKAEIFPKWLALWGIFTVPLILVCAPLMAFGIDVPFALLVPYVPFEFVAGIYILIKY
jgi:uncharacterized membrane protein YidH (DUF202 family)